MLSFPLTAVVYFSFIQLLLRDYAEYFPLSLSSPTFVSSPFFHSLPPVATPLPVVPFSGLLCWPGRSDKNHTPTCPLFTINEINHKHHHYALAPGCPQARDTKRVRKSRIEMQEVDMCRCMAECVCSCLSVMVLMLHMESLQSVVLCI